MLLLSHGAISSFFRILCHGIEEKEPISVRKWNRNLKIFLCQLNVTQVTHIFQDAVIRLFRANMNSFTKYTTPFNKYAPPGKQALRTQGNNDGTSVTQFLVHVVAIGINR